MDNLEYKRNYMRHKNATPKGAAYNRKKIKEWRRKTNAPHSKYRKPRYQEWREAIAYYIIDRDGPTCFYCNKSIDINKYNIAHKLALCLGGKSRLDNLILSCPDCNNKDGILVHRKLYRKD